MDGGPYQGRKGCSLCPSSQNPSYMARPGSIVPFQVKYSPSSPHSPGLLKCAATAAKSLQSCPTLCDPMDCSPPGSTVPGIFQARVLEWGAIAFSVLKCSVYHFPDSHYSTSFMPGRILIMCILITWYLPFPAPIRPPAAKGLAAIMALNWLPDFLLW